MTAAHSVADVLSSKVELEVERIDRMYLNVLARKVSLQGRPGSKRFLKSFQQFQ
jgi:hypothetical protein